mgnify:FL=1
MNTKPKLIALIESFPEKFSIDDLIEKLIFIEKLELGKAQSEKGEVINEVLLDKEIEKWFK